MELEPQPQRQEIPQYQDLSYLQPLPELKNKTKIKLSPLGELDIEAENLSEAQTKELAYFALSINADNVLRQRVVKDICNDSKDIFSHLIAISLVSGIALCSVYVLSKVFTPQPTYSYYGSRNII